MRNPILVLAVFSLLVSITGCIDDGDEDAGEIDYRQEMRDLVISFGEYSRQTDPDFILIPQNGLDLLSDGAPVMDYINNIDGVGQEDLLYGYHEDDLKTPDDETMLLFDLLDLAERNDVEALVTDYCWSREKINDSYMRNEGRGYVSFAADSRDLDRIPDNPEPPHNANDGDVDDLSDVRNFLYLLDPSGYESREEYLDDLRNTDFDLLIIDAFYDVDVTLTYEEVESLKIKKNGGRRLVISYMSIGEAEDYRYYWEDDWGVGDPGFIDGENPDWEGNYKVRYWEDDWQSVIFGSDESYTGRLLSSGFDGAYLDIIDAFEYYE